MSRLRIAGDAGTPELNSGALHRYLAEAVWCPSALLNLGEWHQFARLGACPLERRAKLVGAFSLPVMVDLTVAMEVGLATACVSSSIE